jgi:DNA primase
MAISEIKAKLNILTVLEQYGRKPDKNGMIRCLFHKDKTPSMKVHTDTNTVYCFSGNCGQGGKLMDGIEVIQQVNNLTKYEAVKQAKALVSNGASPVQSKPIIQTENLNDIFQKLKQSLYSSSKAELTQMKLWR